MKIRTGFVTNSSSSCYLITGMDNLQKLTRKELQALSKKMGICAREFMEDCLFLCGRGEASVRSGDNSECELDLGDKQFWSLSYNFWGDEAQAIKILKQIGVQVVLDEWTHEGDIRSRIRGGKISKLEALIVHKLTQREFEEIRKEIT